MALVAQKVQEKADLETDLNDDKSDMKGKKKDRTGPRAGREGGTRKRPAPRRETEGTGWAADGEMSAMCVCVCLFCLIYVRS